MSNFDAGTSVGKYILQADQALKVQQQLIAGYQQLAKASAIKAPAVAGGANVTAEQVKLAQALARVAEAEARKANATTRAVELDARAARATAQAGLAEQKRQTEIARTAKAQDQAAQAAIRRADAERRASQQGGGGPALPRTFAGFTPEGLNQAAGAFGLATLGPQVVGNAISSGVQATQAALALRETKNSLRAVAGDLQTYNQTLQAARDQQRLFGGSLQENIEGLSGLTITARSSGASLQSLIGLSQRLAVLDPAQGAAGARIALNEALSGDPTSLAKRYEIPRAALAKLRDTALPVEERLKVIDSFLNKVGITAESVAGRVDQDALAFRRLGAELGDLQTNAGDTLATTFSGAATGLSRLVGLINQNPQAIAELKAILGGRGAVGESDIADATRQVASARARDQLGGTRGENVVARRAGGTEAFHLIREQLTELNIAGGTAAEQADRLSQAFLNGSVSADTYKAGLQALVGGLQTSANIEDLRAQRIQNSANAQNAAITATREFIGQTQKSAEASVNDAAQKELQQAKTALLQQQTQAAANAFRLLNPSIDDAGVAALVAAGKLDPLIGQMILLQNETSKAKDELLRLANAQNQADTNRAVATGRFFGRESGRGGGSDGQSEGQAFADSLKRQAEAARKAVDDQIALAKAKGRDAEAKRLLNQQLADAKRTGDLGEQARILNEIKSLDAAADRGAKSHTSELNKQVSLEERIRDSKEAQLKASLDAAAATIKDRQDRRKEDQEIRAAQRILGSGRASQQFKDAAQDRLSLIDIERQQRALAIAQQQATAGGTIVNGRVLQSIQSGGAPLPAGAVPTIIGQPIAQAPIGPIPMPPITVNVYLDNEQIAAKQIQILHGDLRRAQSAGVG